MDRIQAQASKLWDLLFDEDTGTTYQAALNLTGTILKEFAQLIWLTLISVFVFGAWFSDVTVKTGKGIRDWVDNRDTDVPAVTDGKSAGEASKDLLEKGRVTVSQLLNQAREQLGLEAQEITAEPSVTKPSITGSSATESSTTNSSVSATTPATTSNQAPSSTATQKPAEGSIAAATQRPTASAPATSQSAQPAKPASATGSVESTSEDVESDWPPQVQD